ncbi:ankyrin repeat-containing domain protein, partial [Globomyces pollinis-pini]
MGVLEYNLGYHALHALSYSFGKKLWKLSDQWGVQIVSFVVMNIIPSHSEGLISVPVEIKQIIAGYLPIHSLLNFKLSSKDLNFNYNFSQAQLHELYHNTKLFSNADAFQSYLQFYKPIGIDLEKAIQENNANIVQLLLKDGRLDPSIGDNVALLVSSEKGYTGMVKLLLGDERVNPSVKDNNAIRLASEHGRTEIVAILLNNRRVDPAAKNNHAIRLASQNGHTEIVNILLNDERVDPTVYDNYITRIASQNGHTEIVQMLLQDKRVDPSSDES